MVRVRDGLSARPALLLDCDDTLYANGFATAQRLTESISAYCIEHLNISHEKAFELYQLHGTCLKGLEVEGIPHDRDHFLEQVHQVELDFARDAHLHAILSTLDHEASEVRVFTASVSSHAMRCLERLGVSELLVTLERPIIDVKSVGFASKHHRQAFVMTQELVAQPDPSMCTLVDDNWTNIRAAKAAGWRTVVCGSVSRSGEPASSLAEADHIIDTIHDLPKVLPEFFRKPL
jgi:putative hydrolase of the HAD superfamily/pyrimidine and pyridine-specific 5'-nucleotidase